MTLEALGLSAATAAIYQAMLDNPRFGVDELARHCRLAPLLVREGLEELGRLMLVRSSSEHPGQLRVVSPEVGLAKMLARQEAELADRQAQLAVSRAAVTRLVAERAETVSPHGSTLLGMDALQARLEQMGHEATTEVLGVHPGSSHRPEDLAAARVADSLALARGVVLKGLYQDTTRNCPHTTVFAQWLLSQGGEVRTAPVLPQRLVIVDRAQALVPIDPADSRKGALHVTEPGIIAALLDLFEQTWATAVPLGAARAEDPVTGLTDTERHLLTLLGTGLTDEAAGQRLGLSPRTVRRQMASLMERLGASSRFEAGLAAARKGWL
ncbi:DNA-binding CsgD family transcriptional regulator/sugar-specific transcriptional regulator TrmB [Kitasatospora sp. MAA4]|uniref:LuxR C-terminal-related transcriptional regulator n=1 Tax=Kitasatospora sp. MAA4 TaxID=3035093 RepID=UPI002473102F|nr:LuxR C-terminal-related transcriptional regulator [Kitasatospora sp. MAA4]MDH6134288.1 DNA-binding CsgD family transcriptional regulator/sugar-specific transcriptional regulator TrmB [Kitasatospora sp. MAA4]